MMIDFLISWDGFRNSRAADRTDDDDDQWRRAPLGSADG
jgi:hypothetical protein